MISDDEEEMNFLMGAVDSSSSDEEENPAMISQELRPDFYASSATANENNLEVNYPMNAFDVDHHHQLATICYRPF